MARNAQGLFVLNGVNEPYWEHDCDSCKWVGSFVCKVDGAAQITDVWASCEGPGDGVLMRTSSDGPEYVSYSADIARRIITQFEDDRLQLAVSMVSQSKMGRA